MKSHDLAKHLLTEDNVEIAYILFTENDIIEIVKKEHGISIERHMAAQIVERIVYEMTTGLDKDVVRYYISDTLRRLTFIGGTKKWD